MVLKSYYQTIPIGIQRVVAVANSTGTSHRGPVLGHIMAFTPSQDELEGKVKGIDEEMDLAAEFAPAPTFALFLLTSSSFYPPAESVAGRSERGSVV